MLHALPVHMIYRYDTYYKVGVPGTWYIHKQEAEIGEMSSLAWRFPDIAVTGNRWWYQVRTTLAGMVWILDSCLLVQVRWSIALGRTQIHIYE